MRNRNSYIGPDEWPEFETPKMLRARRRWPKVHPNDEETWGRILYGFSPNTTAAQRHNFECGVRHALASTFPLRERVRLKPNRREGFPEEFGEYVGPSGNAMHIVCVDKKYRVSRQDDCLREVEANQIERVVRKENL